MGTSNIAEPLEGQTVPPCHAPRGPRGLTGGEFEPETCVSKLNADDGPLYISDMDYYGLFIEPLDM